MRVPQKQWSANQIARLLVRQTFNRAVLAVPNCLWPGSECDLLVVTPNLRVIDVEIKISRADLKADLGKDKWWNSLGFARRADGRFVSEKVRREWPRRVWKHYYVMPATMWKPEFAGIIPPASGVVLADTQEANGRTYEFVKSWRRAKPRRDADRISAEQAIDIARLAGLRMWEALAKLEDASQEQLEHMTT